MLSDIEIAHKCKMKDIGEIAAELGLKEKDIERYGRYKAKITTLPHGKKRGKLVLVTAINPTASGEGKTTVSIGLADGMRKNGKKVCLALREPSLGPVFGIKGGAAGGGYAQVVPMEDINLHFTGDLHAITAANNLLAAMLDNHIFRGNALDIDPEKIYFRRCLDMNDRALRNVTVGRKGEGVEREEHFEITAASEVMAILCLATSLKDLKRRLGNIIVGENRKGEYVFARDLKAEGSMCALLKDAIKPNLVQTLEGTPAIVHGGPFANIAHGCNSVMATYAALSLADYVVTEAGFGADLGAEKFLDTKCRVAGIQPDCVVVVATVKALKLHGGADKANLSGEDLGALEKGLPNLFKHIENIKNVYGKPVVVAMNRFASDTPAEIELVMKSVEAAGAKAVFTDVFLQGGEGGRELADAVVSAAEEKSGLTYAYDLRPDRKEDQRHREARVRRQRRGIFRHRRAKDRRSGSARIRPPSRHHRQNAVFPVRRRETSCAAGRVHRARARHHRQGRRGVHRGGRGQHHADARARGAPRRRTHRRGRKRRDLGAELTAEGRCVY